MSDIEYHNADKMREEDRAAIRAIARALGNPEPDMGLSEHRKIDLLQAKLKQLQTENKKLINKNSALMSRVKCKKSDTISDTIKNVARHYGTTPEDILSERRFKRTIIARQHAMWVLYNHSTLSLPEIGRALNRDHTTVLHGVRRHQERLDREEI